MVLKNVPQLKDIYTLEKLLGGMGVKIDFTDDVMKFDASNVTSLVAPYELVKTMRASVLVLGPLVARFGYAEVSLPGGCAIGADGCRISSATTMLVALKIRMNFHLQFRKFNVIREF